MKRLLFVFGLVGGLLFSPTAEAQESKPLRVFIRAGTKTHGPGQHDHPRFLKDWTELLNQRGAVTKGKIGFPTAAELDETDVLVLYTQEGGTISTEDRANLDKFLKRGGGIVTLHDAVCGTDPQWFKTVIGGAWEHGKSKWYEGEVGVYFIDTEHPITKGASNFDFKDEIYHDLHMMPEAKVLASSFHSVFVVAPQMWTYEKENYRSFVWLQGHEYESFNLPHFRALLLRGIAWAGKRSNVDMLCSKEELGSLKYPVGGPTAPEKAAAKLNVHPDFNISLVTSEPLVEKVISMDWDHKGRLWVAETPEYPGGKTVNQNDATVLFGTMGVPTQRKPKDRVSILEDTNGDGVMDKKTVFADGLELITSLVFYKDGVIVGQAPDIYWLRDSNGDGKCDMAGEKVTLYTGFGTQDTHAVINNFRRGMDGWVYSAIGYSAGNPQSQSGKNFGRVTAGVIRFKPDGSAVEQVTSGTCNTWGFDFAADGEMFYTTATCGEHFLHIVMPEKALARASVRGVRGSAVIPDHQKIFPSVHHTRPAYVQIDWVGQFTASAGCCIYTGGAWPTKYDGSHFNSETTMSLVHNELIKPNGVTYTAYKEPGREETEFVAGSDLWFRPIHTRVGPDGAVYVVDFYNQAAIHNDTRGPKHGARNAATRPDRDHHFARVWRLQHKQAKPSDGKKLVAGNDRKQWVQALSDANGWTRMTAHQLLLDNGAADQEGELKKLVKEGKGYSRIHALWLLTAMGKLDAGTLAAAANDGDAALRKNALKAIADSESAAAGEAKGAVLKALNDSDARARLNALMALANFAPSDDIAQAVVAAYPKLQDRHLEAAALGAVAKEPSRYLQAAFKASDPAMLAGFVTEATRLFAAQADGQRAAELVNLTAQQPASLDGLKRMIVDSLAANVKSDATPPWDAKLKASVQGFLKSSNPGLVAATLSLVGKWDRDGALSAEMKPAIAPLLAKLNDASLSDDERGRLAANLVGVRKLEPKIVTSVAGLLGSQASTALQRSALDALGAVGDADIAKALTDAFAKLPSELRDAALGQIIRRPENTMAFLDAVQQKKIELTMLGPAGVHRLRTHADKDVADKANQIIDAIRGPEMKEKDALIEQFAADVEKPGNMAKGKELFTVNCATCHKYKGQGSDLAPDLTGMGAHGPHDLLVHILDPNRVVEPNFVSVSVETKDDLSYDGIVMRENRTSLVLRNAAGEYDIRQDNIKSRRSTGMSLMPNGFESLGKEGLRDLIGYLCEDEKRFRIIDLRPAFTADSTKGIFMSRERAEDAPLFRRFGSLKADDVPFDIINPVVSQNGNNLIVLKGGQGYAKTMPQKVEIKANAKANVLHFLGGIAGWGYPCCGENQNMGLPVAKATVRYAGGDTEEIIMKNGVEFADWIGNFDVPGSKSVNEFTRRGQMRWFSKPLKKSDTITGITLESFDNAVAPVFVAITAEQSDRPQAAGTGPAAAAAAPAKLEIKGKTLHVGGGASHDYERWFNKEDSATLAKAFVDIQYTDRTDAIPPEALAKLDVLYMSNNKAFPDKAVRDAIMSRARAGKGMLLVHAALWFNWGNWPEYNKELVGGGARRHDNFQEFDVEVTDPNHPIMKGVPTKFKITDELYHFQKDTSGSPIEVLAIGRNEKTGSTYPVVWITKAPGTKIVCITLGHDGKAHELPAFQTLLVNAHNWAAGK